MADTYAPQRDELVKPFSGARKFVCDHCRCRAGHEHPWGQKRVDDRPPSTTQTVVRRAGQYLGLAASGFVIGTANLIPGVSGGTMALLLGIYERLIDAIRALSDGQFLRLLARLKVRQALGRLDGAFLLAVGGGLGLALLALPHFLEWLIATFPTRLESFFFGLVAASILAVGRRVRRWRLLPAAVLIAGAAGTYLLVGLVPAHTPEHPLLLFLATTVAIAAMVLPGVSGAYVLILLGQYQYALNAVTQRDPLRIAIVLLGAGVGLVTFARALSWLFRKWHDLALAALTGMVIGSLRKLWPWKETLVDEAGQIIQQSNVLPAAWTVDVTVDMGLALAAFVLVVILDRRR